MSVYFDRLEDAELFAENLGGIMKRTASEEAVRVEEEKILLRAKYDSPGFQLDEEMQRLCGLEDIPQESQAPAESLQESEEAKHLQEMSLAALEALSRVLDVRVLPTSDGTGRMAYADEFSFSGPTDMGLLFEHAHTGTRLTLRPDGQLAFPPEGTYDASQIDLMRRVAGIHESRFSGDVSTRTLQSSLHAVQDYSAKVSEARIQAAPPAAPVPKPLSEALSRARELQADFPVFTESTSPIRKGSMPPVLTPETATVGQGVWAGDRQAKSRSGTRWIVKKVTPKSVTVFLPSERDLGAKLRGKSYGFRWDGTGFKRQGMYLYLAEATCFSMNEEKARTITMHVRFLDLKEHYNTRVAVVQEALGSEMATRVGPLRNIKVESAETDAYGVKITGKLYIESDNPGVQALLQDTTRGAQRSGMAGADHVVEEDIREALDDNQVASRLSRYEIEMVDLAEGRSLVEKAVSRSQQRIMGMALAVKRGEMSRDEVSPRVLKIADTMNAKDIEDFARTTHDGLPGHVDH